MSLRLALAQMNAAVGDLPGNRNKVVGCLGQARELGVDILTVQWIVRNRRPQQEDIGSE
jgi:predicted amidohydrolase